MTPVLADRILAARSQGHNELVAQLMPPHMRALTSSGTSNVYTVNAHAGSGNAKAGVQATVLITLQTERPYLVLEWRDNPPEQVDAAL